MYLLDDSLRNNFEGQQSGLTDVLLADTGEDLVRQLLPQWFGGG